MTTTIISKETIQRLIKDVKYINKNPLTNDGIYYIHDDTDMLKGYALIIGTDDTPYFGGYYFFEFDFPHDYPHSPPKAKYCTNGDQIRFHPNLYKCGKVCVSLLNTWTGDQWTSCQTISTVLLTLCSLLTKNPLINEPGINLSHIDVPKYNTIVEYSNVNIAICDIVCKKKGVYNTFFDKFYPIIVEHFIKNYDKLFTFCDDKTKVHDTIFVVRTGLYSLNVTINYKTLLQKLIDTKTLIETQK